MAEEEKEPQQGSFKTGMTTFVGAGLINTMLSLPKSGLHKARIIDICIVWNSKLQS